MKRTSVEIYGLAVCFVTLLCFIIALPEFTLNAYEYERHQSNDAFRRAPGLVFRAGPGIAEAVPTTEPSEDETTRQRAESYGSVLRAQRRQAGQSLAMVGIVMLIDILFFLPHWLLARRARTTA